MPMSTTKPAAPGPLLALIFLASGFAGLVYESIWTHYLQLFLGHAAYAQTLVLGIFMGGMAIGAAAVARYSPRIASPLRAYAAVEAAIGVLALVFHPVFTATTSAFFEFAFTRHLDGAAFAAAKWSLGALMILPQSILLGATFPLFTAAATRRAPQAAGRAVATLYFSNSLGGAIGALVSGFVLIPAAGLPGTIVTAGLVNLAIAGAVLALARREPAPAASPREASAARGAQPGLGAPMALLLAVSFFTGATSFVYEIGWIRMLALVLGSATHSFELMLSAFVLGLALGGGWIRKRIDGGVDAGVMLGWVQVAMGAAALATVPLHNLSFDVVAWAVRSLPRTDEGYTLFNLVRYGVAAAIMLPATFFAGMTLPLATRALFASPSQGERAIGRVYSANTVGSIAGLVFAVHVGMPRLGLQYLVSSGAVVDVLLGAVILALLAPRSRLKYAAGAVVASIAGMAAAAHTFSPEKLASGVFRRGQATTGGTVVESADGKTATISVIRSGDVVGISTNGKPDASATMNPLAPIVTDQATQVLTGALPVLLHPAPRRVATVGFGSGMSSEVVLADPRVAHLDTIEIEPKMVALAKHFDPLNRRVYTDPRSTIRIEDAKSFFAESGRTYDVIISEPSNPWVSGVAGLFSVEFYRHASRYLNADGLFAQWLQNYETSAERMASVLKAMDQSFDDYVVFAIDPEDVLLVGKPHGKLALDADLFARASPAMRARLRKVGVGMPADITLRIAGDKALFHPWLQQQAVPANSDFAPYLDVNADRDRFFGRNWIELSRLAFGAAPVPEVLGHRPPLPSPAALTFDERVGPDLLWLDARQLRRGLLGPEVAAPGAPAPLDLPANLPDGGRMLLDACMQATRSQTIHAAALIATRVLPYLSPDEDLRVLDAMRNAACIANPEGGPDAWPALLRYVAARDADGFGRLADRMLENGLDANDPAIRVYLLAVAMLGRIHAGQPERAAQLWERHSAAALGKNPPGLALEVLRAHAFASGR